jgi:hypothetical protein
MLSRWQSHNHPPLLSGNTVVLQSPFIAITTAPELKGQSMFKPFIAGITAVSLAFATATPAQANDFGREDFGKLLIGLAAIAAVGAVVRNNDRDKPDRPQTTQTDHRRDSWADLNRPRVRDQHRNARVLPRQCLQTIETRFGQQRLFGQRCLERNDVRVNRLPDRCAVRFYTPRGPRAGFDPLCLREQGYTSTRR